MIGPNPGIDTPPMPGESRRPRGRNTLVLVLLCLAVYVPGLRSLPTVDRDEARFAQASRQMFEAVTLPADRRTDLHAGGLVVPMVGDRMRLNKPPMIYWLQSAAAAACTFGDPSRDAIWMYRLPSLAAGIVIVLATRRLGSAMFTERVGTLAGGMIAVCPAFVWEAHQARADMALVAFTVLAVEQLWLVRTATGRSTRMSAVLFWVFVALGVMTKGPITPMVVVLVALGTSALTRQWRWLAMTRPAVGLVIVGAVVGPWVWGVAQRVGFDLYWSTIADEVLARSAGAKEGHWGPPGYHTLLALGLFWPGLMLVGVAIARSAHRTWSRHTLREAFLIAWLVPAWIIFELIATKLPHYTMTLYPALAILGARGVLNENWLHHPLARLGVRSWRAFATGMIALGSAASVLGLVPAAFILIRLWRARTTHSMQRAALAGAALASISIVGVALPYLLPPGWITPNVMREIQGLDPTGSRPIASVRFHEDSLVFATRGTLVRLNEDQLDEYAHQHADAIIIAPPELAEAHAQALTVRATASGFNIAKGRTERLAVCESARGP